MDKPVMKCFTVLSHTTLNSPSVKLSHTFRWQQHATPSYRERQRDTESDRCLEQSYEGKNKEGLLELIISLIL